MTYVNTHSSCEISTQILQYDRNPIRIFFKNQNIWLLVPIALFFGLVAPALIGLGWGDITGAFVWAGLVARVISEYLRRISQLCPSYSNLAWHCTFLVNS